MAALQAGKPVYVEKPMSVSFASATNMMNAASERNIKLSVAHYRREQPLFKKIKQLLADKAIGDIRFARLDYYRRSLSKEELSIPKSAWRVDSAIAGGGLFHDLAPHQLDLMNYFFGEVEKAFGFATNQAGLYNADDIVAGSILYKTGVLFNGMWCFNVAEDEAKDYCEIIGSEGKISFPIFEHKKITLTKNMKTEIISFEPLLHVQQPLIEKVVEYFLDKGPNPCSAQDGAKAMQLIDSFTGK
jgi:predicted dehydrogenase